MSYVICLPGIPKTGEPPGFLLSGKAPGERHVWIATDHPKFRPDSIRTFQTKEEADRWLIERALERPDADGVGDWEQLGNFIQPRPVVVEDSALTNWKQYSGLPFNWSNGRLLHG